MIRRLRYRQDGQDLEVVAQKIGGKLWFHVDGETHVYEPESSSANPTGPAGLHPDRIEAPMPGKIVRLEVKVGDAVRTGQLLVVMEAMKMEYSLSAAADGTVEEVGCSAGDQVRLSQLLIQLKLTEKGHG